MASMIVAGARTPVGKFGGAFKDVPAVSLGAHAIRASLDRAGIAGKEVDYVIMGHVLQAGAGQITARQAAIEAGIPPEVPALTINKVCLSGLNAIALADQLIRAGEVEVVVAAGGLLPRGDPRPGMERKEGTRPDTPGGPRSNLAPALKREEPTTAGNASQISDGAAAVVVMSEDRARKLGAEPLAEVVAHGMSADRYAWLHTVPALALVNALKKAGLTAGDLDLVEINEAFAAVALNVTRMLELDEERVNVNGGAVAIGHPIGASGARLVLTLAHELKRRGLRTGAATLCGGGGQGDALIIRR